MPDNRDAVCIDSYTKEDIKGLIAQHAGNGRVPAKINIITDTSDFFRVDYNDVLMLNNLPYLIKNHQKEGRFGINDQPKFWVKTAIDLTNGNQKIIKMVFHEKFQSRVGDLLFNCVRSPKKEARILDLVKGHPHFMQGFSSKDTKGNIIRVIDYIYGTTLSDLILTVGKNHEDYFFNYYPFILNEYIDLVKGIQFLHDHNEKHGDIRRDHIIKEKDGGPYRWIDFDFNYMHRENMFGYDLFGLGNILVYITSQGDITTQDLKKNNAPAFRNLSSNDLNIVFNNRVVNLKKIYPYIPESLNNILLHFSTGANIFYDNTAQLLNDLQEAKESLCTQETAGIGIL